ncbi:hypothetical protein GH714_028501 [Hevea brasiliensis]|uniref:Amine oxidase n=1 Tax=Hevea brasiliensis TaxID=3981 RepID=A0A6A6LJQ6_HEVBR|nr:hypothetical protein GH714_028501 [Hevea brasiliensis]
MSSLIRPVESLNVNDPPPPNPTSAKAAKISVAVATVRAAGATPEIRNTRTVNRTGQLTRYNYKLVPGSNCLPLAGSEAKFLRRAAFLKHNLGSASCSYDEMYPGG